MFVTLVEVEVKPEYLAQFIEATRINHEASVLEAGNLRFDVLQDPLCPTTFILYEAYERQEQAQAHKSQAHYQVWRDTVAEMMQSPRSGRPMQGLFP